MVKLLLTLVVVGTLALSISTIYPAEDPMLRKIAAVETDSPPKIDGKLDDPCWQKAAQTGDFIQFEPNAGEPASHKTRVYLLYDRDRLYVGFECFKSDMNVLAANSVQRDSFFFSDDHVEILIDTYLDQRNCYAFSLNPLSTQTDRRITNEGGNVRRSSSNVGSAIAWDCDWAGHAAKYDDRWTAEFSIPFAELRFPQQNPQGAWGINFWRNDESRQEELSWVELGGRQYAVSHFGHLTGLPLDRLVMTRPLEVKPYGTLKPEKIGDQDPELDTAAGIDVRYPFSSVTFDFTLNPDFAQIEADPDRVNLSDIPLRFPEKRPFFLEGNELFQTPVELFYSRRVEDLMYGGKVIGKLSDYNFAILNAQAGPENVAFKTKSRFGSDLDREILAQDLREVFDKNDLSLSDITSVAVKDKAGKWLITDATEEKQYTIIEQGDRLNVYEVDADHLPADEYNYSVFRVQRELGRNSAIGLLGVNKQGESLYDRASGIDARFRLPADVNFNLEYAREWRSGIESDDPISDDIIFAEFSRRANVFSFEARYIDIGEDFDVETGFIPRTDRRGVEFSTRYNKQYAGSVQRLRGEGRYERLYNHAGELTNERYRVDGLIGVKNVFLFTGPEWYYHFDDDDGVGYTDKVLNFFAGWFPPKWVRIRNFGSVGIRDDKDTFFIRPEITVRPTAKLDLELTLQRLVEDSVLEQWTRRFAINYQFAQRMFFRSSAELTIDDERRIFALFAYEYLPESTFFLVYNNNREKDGETEQIVFVKLAHLLKVGLF